MPKEPTSRHLLPTQSGVRWIWLLGFGFACAAIALSLTLRAFALLPHPADEGIYFYGAKRMAEGLWPYRDFFHAHPPLHLAPTALLFAATGYSYAVAKAPLFFWSAICGLACFLTVDRLMKLRCNDSEEPQEPQSAILNAWVRAAAATCTIIVFCLAESHLKAASTDTGIVQACGWLSLAALALVHGRAAAAGTTLAAAPLTLLQAAPAAGVLALSAALLGRRAALRCWAFAAGVFTGAHLLLWLVVGSPFFEQVYAFHLDKVGSPTEGFERLRRLLFDNSVLFLGAAGGALCLFANRRAKDRAIAGVCAAWILATFVVMGTRPKVFPFYFLPAFFPAALLCGLFVQQIFEFVRRCGAARGVRARSDWAQALIIVAALSALTFARPHLQSWISPRRSAQIATYAQAYTWRDAPGIGALNSVLKVLFWQRGQRIPGNNYNPVTQYLWQRSRWLDIHPQMVDAVIEAAQVHQQGDESITLFGDSTTVPLVALDAGCAVTGDVVDTNLQRFRSGHLALSRVKALLQMNPKALVLIGRQRGIGTIPAFRQYVAAHYAPVREFNSQTGRRYLLLARKR